jgi:hypothetical protein
MTEDLLTQLRLLLDLFDAHYVCPNCNLYSAHYLETCLNPLHELHEALYRLERNNGV